MTQSSEPKKRITESLNRVAFRVSARFKYVLFPLDIPTFAAALTARDFIASSEPPEEPIAIPPGGAIGGRGIVGRKGDLRADIDTDKQFFGVSGRQDPKLVIGELRSLIAELSDVVDLTHAEFFELQTRYKVARPGGALAMTAHLGQKAKIVEIASKAFSQPLQLYSAQLISRGGEPNSPDYFEIWLQPVPSLASVLGLAVIMRKPDLNEFERLAYQLEEKISALLSLSAKDQSG